MNKVMLVGNLGTEPVIRYTKDGQPVVSFSMATNKRWKDQLTGELKQKTEWHKVVIFNSIAERAKSYLKRGLSVKIEGEIRTKRWMDENGVMHFGYEIVTHDFELVGKRERREVLTYSSLKKKKRNLKKVENLKKILDEKNQASTGFLKDSSLQLVNCSRNEGNGKNEKNKKNENAVC
jgi:single-strand DNA-binding protein